MIMRFSNNHHNLDEPLPRGVFGFLINEAAVIDKVTVGIWGTPRTRPQTSVCIESNFAIASEGGMYARSIHGNSCTTRTPFELKYGKLWNYRKLPPFRLSLRSDKAPVTGAQVLSVANALFRKSFTSYVSGVEMAFDLDVIEIPSLIRGLWTRARTRTDFRDREGRRTIYLGTPWAAWQNRIYQKADRIIRVEYVFRLPFLQTRRIREPQDVIRLGQIRLGKLVRFSDPAIRKILHDMAQRLIW